MVFRKSGKVGRMVVVPYTAYYREKLLSLLLAVFIGAFTAGMYFGKESIVSLYGDLDVKNRLLTKRLGVSDSVNNDLTAEVARLTLNGDVDRSAAENVRHDFLNFSNTIAELEEAVAFYRGVLDPDKNKQGLSIVNVSMTETGLAQQFRYKLVVMQLAGSRSFLKGNLNFAVIGLREGKTVRLPLHTLSAEVKSKDIKLWFKYFQEISGELTLPEGFDPQKIEVVAVSMGRHSVAIEQQYDWSIQEN